MTQYKTLNVKFCNSQLSKLKLNYSSNVIDDSNDEANFLHKLLLKNSAA